ncbi:MAG: right-handed parallel beta-helix repeat-containing protein [Crocinitomicaceae bacterium]
MIRLLLLFLIALFFTFKTRAAIWYVNLNATGANSGTSWVNAFADLQNAISASNFGDEIWVAAGTYKPTTTTTRSISFLIKNGTKVYGGFNGTETQESQRNSVLNGTILSGEIGTGSTSDNTYNVVYFSNVGIQTEIDGFTILAGYTSAGSGAGIRSANSSPTVGHCRIVGNYADIGGGLSHGSSGNITIHNCVFEGNISATQGGAINLYVGTNNTITNCSIISNQSNGIGGILCVASSSSAALTVSNTVMANNTSNSSGIYFNSGSLVTLNNCLIVGNFSTTTGIIRTETASSSKANKIVNCTIAHNNQGISSGSANTSVALNNESSIENSIIYGNNSLSQVLGTGVSMSNCIMQSGTSSASGTNVLSTNPNFIAPASFNVAPFDTIGYDYRLKAISPGINFGLNASVIGATDLDGNSRIQNTTVDLGAFESNFCTSSLTLSPAAPYTICNGSPITLSVAGAVDYMWSSGSTNSSINVTSAGNYSVVFEDTAGCRGALQAIVTSSANPSPNIVFSGGSLNAGTFASYQWFFNGSPILGATGSSHVPLEGYGVYSIDVYNTGGCFGTDTYCFSPAALNTTGPTSFCFGESVTLNVSGGTAYVWSNGELDSSITVSTAGTYTVTVQNATAGCSVVLQQAVSVIALPTPTITYSGGLLGTGSFTTYQWSFNGVPISGLNSQNIAPTNGNGQYTVTVTNSSNCEGMSSVYNYSNLQLDELSSELISIYPNPLSGNGYLKFTSDQLILENLTISLYDGLGSNNLKISTTGLPESIALPDLKPGIYFLNIEAEGQQLKSWKITIL